MLRVLNFFLIGLAAGSVILFQYHRDQMLEQEIRLLKSVTANSAALAGRVSGAERSDIGGARPKTDDLPSLPVSEGEIYNSRANAITRAIARTSNAVVGINVVQVREVRNPWLPTDPMGWMLFDERMWPQTVKQKVKNLGSGFIISSDGYIVTNEHVVRDASEVVITTTTGHKYTAKIVGTDPLLDMALLKIDATDLPSIPLGDSDDAIVGEWTIAIGNPYGLFDVNDEPSVSVGVVSAMHRDFESEIDGRLYSDMIQTDASINRGNSGGPLINAEGEAIGMNTLIFSENGGSVGIGFAIPSNRIAATIDDLLKGGVNRKFWVGIRAIDLTPTLARLQGLPDSHGAVVTSVEAGSPAAKAGVRMEDVILDICGRPVESARTAAEILKSTDLRVGDRMPIKICRSRKVFEVNLILSPLPAQGG
jgi:serine protease Do